MTTAVNSSVVIVERKGAVAYVRFNRPDALNAMSLEAAREFYAVCHEIKSSSDIRVVVLAGNGKAFMAGGDISYFHANMDKAAAHAQELLQHLNAGIQILTDLPQIVVASVHGAAVGAGLSIVLACDLIVADTSARFNLAFSRIGACPDSSATWTLPRTVGLHKALELALLADTFDAQQALQMGIVSRVVEPDQLAEETAALAERLANGPSFAFAHTKRLLRASLGSTLGDQLAAEAKAIGECAATADFSEGINAFFERRPARYVGC